MNLNFLWLILAKLSKEGLQSSKLVSFLLILDRYLQGVATEDNTGAQFTAALDGCVFIVTILHARLQSYI